LGTLLDIVRVMLWRTV